MAPRRATRQPARRAWTLVQDDEPPPWLLQGKGAIARGAAIRFEHGQTSRRLTH